MLFKRQKYEIIVPSNCLSKLTWDEAMELSPVLDGASKTARRQFLNAVANQAGNGVAAALQSANLMVNGGKMLVEFEQKSQALRFMSKMGRDLAIQVSKNSGRTAEVGKLATKGAAFTSAATATVGAVVIVAHMISAADNAKKLREANQKLDFLILARRIDQCAKMEAVFRQAKELLSLPDSPENRRELHRLGLNLHELRAAWRAEVRHRLDEIDLKRPEDTGNWLMKPVRRMRSGANSTQATSQAQQNLIELHLLNVNLAMHVALAQASGTLDPFLQNSLPEEMRTTRKLAVEVANLCEQIPPKHKLATKRIREIERAFNRTLEIFEPMGKIASQESLDVTVSYIEPQ